MDNHRYYGYKQLLFAVLLICLSPGQAYADSISYFRSNSLGMPLEKITAYQTDDYEYKLIRIMNDEGLVEELYRDKKLVQQARYEFKGDTVYARFYRDGKLIREDIEEDNRLQEEIFHVPEGMIRQRYFWKDGNLMYLDIIQPDMKAERRRYVRSDAGQLVQILREEIDLSGNGTAAEVVSSFQYGTERESVSQWHVDETGCTHFLYQDDTMRTKEKYCRGVLVFQWKEYREGGMKVVTETHPVENYFSRSVFSEDGKIQDKIIRSDSGTEQEKYTYREGVLIEKRLETAELTQVTEYMYSGDTGNGQDLLYETVYENAVQSKKISYLPDGQREVVLYRKGLPVVELLYQDEELIQRKSLIGKEE